MLMLTYQHFLPSLQPAWVAMIFSAVVPNLFSATDRFDVTRSFNGAVFKKYAENYFSIATLKEEQLRDKTNPKLLF